jgi:hypothetical protein
MKLCLIVLLSITSMLYRCGIVLDPIELQATQQDFLLKDRGEVLEILGTPLKTTGLTGNGEILYYQTKDPESSCVLTLNDGVVKDIAYVNHRDETPAFTLEKIKAVYSDGLDWDQAEPYLSRFFKTEVFIRSDENRLVLQKEGVVYVYDEPSRWENSKHIKVIYP